MTSPEQIQQQIERTRGELSDDVDRLTEKVSPPRVASRQVGRVKARAGSLRDKVMGSADDGSGLRGAGSSLGSTAGDMKDAVGSAGGSAKDAIGSATGTAKDAVTSAPDTIRSQAQGNPLAAGLVAFGVGMVISSLLPASQREQQLAAQAEDKAKGLAEPAKQAGQHLAEELKPAAQQAVDEVKSTAQDAAAQTTEQAKSAAEDVRAPLQQ